MGLNTVKPVKKKTGLIRFLQVLLGILILTGSVYGLQYFFHILDGPMQYFNRYLSIVNGMVFKEMFWGISTGMILFLLILIVFPVFMKNVNTRSYFKNLFSGILSSFIFFITQWIYEFCEKISQFYLILSIAGLSVVVLVLIGIVTRIYKKEEDKIEFRTQYIASITAGLIFSILLKLIGMVFGLMESGIQNAGWISLP